MTVTGANKPNLDEPESADSFISFENMNIDDFMLPDLRQNDPQNGGPSNNNYHHAPTASGNTTPHYNASPAPSGTSTPGLNPSQNNSTPFSPANMSANSPRPVNSPMVGMPMPSPSGNGPQNSRPPSTNSAMGAPPMSPYGHAMPSPQMATPMNQQAPMGAPNMAPSTMRAPPMTPPVSQSSQMGLPNMTPPVNHAPPMGGTRTRTPPVSHIPMVVGPGITPPMQRPSMVSAPNRPALMHHMPSMGDPRMVQPKQTPMIRGLQPINQMNQHMVQPRFNPAKNPGYKIYELNKRLQERNAQSEGAWWDYFVCEFFEDNASLTLSLCLEDGPKNFTIGRTLIPRFFRSFYDGGAMELFFNLRQSKEWLQNNSIMVDSDQCAMETLYVNPMYTKVISEGRLMLEFVANEMMRIKSWHFAARGWQEQIPRSVLSMQAQQQNPAMMQQWAMNITRQGFPNTTLNYLRLCCILQPMQQIMTMHKSSGLDPRDCLKTTLVKKWQKVEEPPTPPVVPAPQEPTRPAPKPRKKRKNAADKETTTNARKKRSPEPANVAPPTDQADVMVVGEPSLMGGGLGKDDERFITRIENSHQFAMGNNAPMGNGSAPGGDTSWSLDDVLSSTLSAFAGQMNEQAGDKCGMDMGHWPH